MEPHFGEGPPIEVEQPRRRSGCFWGCLAVALIVVLGVGGTVGYRAWTVYRGFESDTQVQAIMEVVRNDARAEALLGRDIRISAVQSQRFGQATGLGKTATYTMRLVGSNAEGELKVNFDLSNGQSKIVLMVLTGPDGHPHTLVGKDAGEPFVTF